MKAKSDRKYKLCPQCDAAHTRNSRYCSRRCRDRDGRGVNSMEDRVKALPKDIIRYIEDRAITRWLKEQYEGRK